MMTTLRNRQFARLFVASLVSEIGSKIHRIALLVLVYSVTQQAWAVAVVLGVQLAASIGISPLLAPWVDTQERRRLLIWSDLLRVPVVCAIPLLGVKALPVLLLLVFVNEVLRGVHDPVSNAVIPALLPETELDNANGLMLFAQRFSEVAFVGAAGLLVTLVGVAPAFLIDGVSFAVSAAICMGLPVMAAAPRQVASYWSRVRAGISFLWTQPAIRKVVITLFTAATFGSIDSVLGVILAVSILKAGSAGYGFMESAMALGAVLGTFVVARCTTHFRRERLLVFGLICFGIFEASYGLFPLLAWVVVAHFVCGMANMVFIVPARSILQLNTPAGLRARVFAAFGAVMNSAVLAGTLLAGLLEKPLGAPATFVLGGTTVVVVATVVTVGASLAAVRQRSVSLPQAGETAM